MPIFDYHCSKCNDDQEYIWFSDVPDKVRCELCGSSRVKVLSVPARPQLEDNATWLHEHANVVSREYQRGEREMKTRSDFHNYLSEKGLRQKDSFNRTEV
jgi:putative FmdB family regulatory protein